VVAATDLVAPMNAVGVLATSVAAGEVVFGVFAVLMLVLAGFVIRFAVRSSRRARREADDERRSEAADERRREGVSERRRQGAGDGTVRPGRPGGSPRSPRSPR